MLFFSIYFLHILYFSYSWNWSASKFVSCFSTNMLLRWKSICKYFPWNQFEIPFLSSFEFNLQICFLPVNITADMVHSVSECSRNIPFLYGNDSISFRLQKCFPCCFEFTLGNLVSKYFSKGFGFLYDVQLWDKIISFLNLHIGWCFVSKTICETFSFFLWKKLQTILFLIWLSVAKSLCLLPDYQAESFMSFKRNNNYWILTEWKLKEKANIFIIIAFCPQHHYS